MVKFIKLYNTVSSKSDNVKPIDDTLLERLQKNSDLDIKRKRVDFHIFMTFLFSFLIGMFPFLLSKTFDFANLILSEFIEFLKATIIQNHQEVIFYISFIIGLLICSILLFFRSDSNIKTENIENSISDEHERGFWKLQWAKYVTIYIIVVFISLVLILEEVAIINYVKIGLNIIISIPVALFILFCFLFIFVLLYNSLGTYKVDVAFSFNNRIEICGTLLEIYISIESYDNFLIIPDKVKKEIIESINDVGHQIEKIPERLIIVSNKEVIEDFKQFSNSFRELTTEFVYSENCTTTNFKNRIIEYFNIFISDDLSKLSKSNSNYEKQISKKGKILRSFLFTLLLVGPIIIVLSIIHFFNYEFDSVTLSLLKIIYLVWVLICLLTNPFVLNSDRKEFIKELMKLLPWN